MEETYLKNVKKSSRQSKNRRKADTDKGSLSRVLKRLETGSARRTSGIKVKIKYN